MIPKAAKRISEQVVRRRMSGKRGRRELDASRATAHAGRRKNLPCGASARCRSGPPATRSMARVMADPPVMTAVAAGQRAVRRGDDD
jgi:hypothetical protein